MDAIIVWFTEQPLEAWASVAAAVCAIGFTYLFLFTSSFDRSSNGEVFLNRKIQEVTLAQVWQLSPDTKKLRFKLDKPNRVLGLPVGQHFKVHAPNQTKPVKANEWNGRPDKEANDDIITRSYTPTSSDNDLGIFDLVIKVYKGGVIERFPDGGKMSQYIDTMLPGDKLKIQGPFGMITYQNPGQFFYGKNRELNVKNVGMIAGGTGITPMLQVIEAILRNPSDTTKMSLLFGNQTEDDILLKSRLDQLARDFPGRFAVHYTLDRPPKGYTKKGYSKGFVTLDMMKEHLFPYGDGDAITLCCGPPPMVKGCIGNLEKWGYPKTHTLSF